MNTQTGGIVDWERFAQIEKENPKEAEKYVPLSDELYAKLSTMNRKQRREYYKRHKNEFPGKKWQAIGGSHEHT